MTGTVENVPLSLCTPHCPLPPILQWADPCQSFRLDRGPLLPGLLGFFGKAVQGGRFLLCCGRSWLLLIMRGRGEAGEGREWVREGCRRGSVSVCLLGRGISSSLCTQKEVKGGLWAVAEGSPLWLHKSCRVAPRLSSGSQAQPCLFTTPRTCLRAGHQLLFPMLLLVVGPLLWRMTREWIMKGDYIVNSLLWQ